MNPRTTALLALLGLLVVALFALGLGTASGSRRADPAGSPGIAALGNLLDGVPGLRHDLQANEVRAGCFDGRSFIAAAAPCVVTVPAGTDRIRLGLVSGRCLVVVTQEGAVPQRLTSDRHFTDGRIAITLTGAEATVSIGGDGVPSACVLALNPG